MSAVKKSSSSAAKKETRHGRRAPGKTATSVSLSGELLDKARAAADADGRSFSNWLEKTLREALRSAGRTVR